MSVRISYFYTMKLAELTNFLERLAPLNYQEDYDNSGLIVGNANDESTQRDLYSARRRIRRRGSDGRELDRLSDVFFTTKVHALARSLKAAPK